MRILFLMSEMSGYFYKCITTLQDNYEVNVKVLCKPSSAAAPFDFRSGSVQLIDKNSFGRNELLKQSKAFNPQLCFIAGWEDKDYMSIVRRLRKIGTVVVCGMDNPWTGSMRQYLAVIFSKLLFHPYYDFMWIPGNRQYFFARRLGFSHGRILRNLYVADTEAFRTSENKVYSKQLLFVGRLEKIKGVLNLYNAFSRLTVEERNEWKLRIIGNGSLKDQLEPTDSITVENFKQPSELISETKLAGAFILPSLHEPWGLVVQEFAARKLPLLLSKEVGAGEQFLIHDYNGYVFDVMNPDDFKKALVKICSKEVHELKGMGDRSCALAQKPDEDMWCSTILSAHSLFR